MKSYSFYSHKLNQDKFNLIKNYAIKIRDNKNVLSNYLYDNYKLDLYYNSLAKYDFVNKTKFLRNDIGATTYQQVQMEVYTRYKTQIDKLNYKANNTSLGITIKYLVKAYKGDKLKLVNYLSNSKKLYHKEILNHINKFNDRLFGLVKSIQNRLLKKLKLIEFKSLTFSDINQLSDGIDMIELSKLKLSNAIINLNIPNVSKIVIPTKYSKKYHGDLNDYKFSINKKTKQKRYTYKMKIEKNRVRIIFSKNNENLRSSLKIDNENIIGIDVNVKNNLFSLSDNEFIKYDEWILKKYYRYQKYISRIQSNKDKRNLDKRYGKKAIKRIQKMNRISKYYNDLKSNELVKYCQDNGIKHIVMEDLNLRNSKTRLKRDGINYNDIIKVLHLNDYKNAIKRIANREDIMVSLVDPSYTSQTCSKCGCIDRNNRKNQETFSCIECGYKINADTNASINIKNRISIDYLRNNLMKYDEEYNGYRAIRKFYKPEYIELYSNLNL